MLRIDARSVAACVVDNVAIGDLPVGKVHSNPVRFSIRAAERKDAVTVLVGLSGPQPAIANLAPLGIEPSEFFGRRVTHCHPSCLVDAVKTARIVKDFQ